MARQFAVVLMILYEKAMMTGTLTWNTEVLSNTCCQSKNQLLMWNFTKGENERILELQWFFNETTLIGIDSEVIGFHVETLYHGRIERIGKAGIILKNVSSGDAGIYTLYVKLAEENIRNIQHISLGVVEQIPYQCKPIIEIHHPDGMYCSTTCLERSHLSPEWIIKGIQDSMVIGRYLAVHAGINGQTFCCLHDWKCHNEDQLNFCMPNPIPSMARILKEGTNCEDNKTSIETLLVLQILVLMMTTHVFVIAVTVTLLVFRRRKSLCVKLESTQILQEVPIAARLTISSISSLIHSTYGEEQTTQESTSDAEAAL